MLNLILPVLAGAAAGAAAGGLLAWWLLRRRQRSTPSDPPPLILDPAVLRDIDEAAKAWAASHGQPDTVAGLVADKLRLVYELTARRGRGQ
jgi:hypothetical protein